MPNFTNLSNILVPAIISTASLYALNTTCFTSNPLMSSFDPKTHMNHYFCACGEMEKRGRFLFDRISIDSRLLVFWNVG